MEFTPNKKKLPNGITTIDRYVPEIDFVYFEIFSKVGSGIEDTTTEGVIHLLEHLLLSCNQRYPNTYDLKRAIRQKGGITNGSTGKNDTRFYIKIPTVYFDFGKDFIIDLLNTKTINLDVLAEQLRIITKEKKDATAKFGRKFFYNTKSSYWGEGNGYSIDTLGNPDELQTMPQGVLLDFLDMLLSLENVTISLVGNYTIEQKNELLNLLTKLSRPKPKAFTYPDDVYKYSTTAIFNEPLCKNIFISLLVPLPSYNACEPQDIIDYQFASGVLYQKLNDRLRIKDGLLYNLTSSVVRNTENLFTFKLDFTASTDTLEKILTSFFNEWKLVVEDGINAKEFEYFKSSYVHSFMLRNTSAYDEALQQVDNLIGYGRFFARKDALNARKNVLLVKTNKIIQSELDYKKANLYLYGDIGDLNIDLEKIRQVA